MQAFTPSLGSWLRRLSARNPLVRGSDRVEAGAILLVLIVALLAAPVAGALGTATFDNLTHRFAADRLNRQEVMATVAGVDWPSSGLRRRQNHVSKNAELSCHPRVPGLLGALGPQLRIRAGAIRRSLRGVGDPTWR
jgi:hypothetical protein